jgi:hypothetical protein
MNILGKQRGSGLIRLVLSHPTRHFARPYYRSICCFSSVFRRVVMWVTLPFDRCQAQMGMELRRRVRISSMGVILLFRDADEFGYHVQFPV